MLKRNGEPCQYNVPGFAGKLTRAEMDAYNEAFETIRDEFDSLQRIGESLKVLITDPAAFTTPDDHLPHGQIETRDQEGTLWRARSRLLSMNHGDVFLCDRLTSEGKEFAVINRFSDSPYARAHGAGQMLLSGKDPLPLIQDFAENAEHTLRFMASNMVAVAHKVVWERYANQNPARVVRAISDRCAAAVSNTQSELQAHAFQRKQGRKQPAGNRV